MSCCKCCDQAYISINLRMNMFVCMCSTVHVLAYQGSCKGPFQVREDGERCPPFIPSHSCTLLILIDLYSRTFLLLSMFSYVPECKNYLCALFFQLPLQYSFQTNVLLGDELEHGTHLEMPDTPDKRFPISDSGVTSTMAVPHEEQL